MLNPSENRKRKINKSIREKTETAEGLQSQKKCFKTTDV